jgi:hypothetical protein
MNPDLYCLSLLELLELRDGAGTASAQRHLEDCPRCQALLRTLPPDLSSALSELVPAAPAPEATATVRPIQADGGVRTGALWRAVPEPGADFAWVVVIIGRSPDSDDCLVVAPVVPHPELATDRDLLVRSDVLGYPAFIDITNLGILLRDQLLDQVGQLHRPEAEVMIDLYRHVLHGAPAPQAAARGLPALDEADPRLLEQAARAEAVRDLWRPAHSLVQDVGERGGDEVRGREGEPRPERVPAGAAAAISDMPEAADRPGVSLLLRPRLQGPDADWDRNALLEQSGAAGAHLDGFLRDQLDLTDKRDVADLARVAQALGVDWPELESAVVVSLQRSPGGTRQAQGPALRMAARSRAGADPARTARDLFADRTRVDDSEQAREKEIQAYLTELRRELEDLE